MKTGQVHSTASTDELCVRKPGQYFAICFGLPLKISSEDRYLHYIKNAKF